MRRLRATVTLGVVALFGAFNVSPALAHPWTEYYNAGMRWEGTLWIDWFIDTSYANKGDAFVQRAVAAAFAWNNQSSGFRFSYNSTPVTGITADCEQNPVSAVRHGPGGGGRGRNQNCWRWNKNRWEIYRFVLTIDSQPTFSDGTPATWYAGTDKGA